ncbi:hypothetical protein EON63_20135, partial [archaeon]
MGCFNSKVSNDHPHKKPIEISARSSHKNSLRLLGTETESVKTLTFKHVMKDPMGREFFMKVLKLEHAEENMLFFEVRSLDIFTKHYTLYTILQTRHTPYGIHHSSHYPYYHIPYTIYHTPYT